MAEQPSMEVQVMSPRERVEMLTRSEIARQNPRNIQRTWEATKAEMESDSENSGALFYAIPRKKRKPDSNEYETIYIEGLSIRAAAIVSRNLPNHDWVTRIEPDAEDSVDVLGLFIDHETNRRIVRAGRVHKLERTRDGKVELVRLDIFHQNIMGMQSRVARNVLFEAVPVSFRTRMLEIAKGLAGKGEIKGKPADPKVLAESILKEFAQHGVDRAALEKMLGKKLETATNDDRARLRGVLTALRDGMVKGAQVATPDPVEPEQADGDAPLAMPEPAPAAASAPAAKPEPAPAPTGPTGPTGSPKDAMIAEIRALATSSDHGKWPAKVSKPLMAMAKADREAVLREWQNQGKLIKAEERKKK